MTSSTIQHHFDWSEAQPFALSPRKIWQKSEKILVVVVVSIGHWFRPNFCRFSPSCASQAASSSSSSPLRSRFYFMAAQSPRLWTFAFPFFLLFFCMRPVECSSSGVRQTVSVWWGYAGTSVAPAEEKMFKMFILHSRHYTAKKGFSTWKTREKSSRGVQGALGNAIGTREPCKRLTQIGKQIVEANFFFCKCFSEFLPKGFFCFFFWRWPREWSPSYWTISPLHSLIVSTVDAFPFSLA